MFQTKWIQGNSEGLYNEIHKIWELSVPCFMFFDRHIRSMYENFCHVSYNFHDFGDTTRKVRYSDPVNVLAPPIKKYIIRSIRKLLCSNRHLGAAT